MVNINSQPLGPPLEVYPELLMLPCAGGGSRSRLLALHRADSHNTHRLSVLWCGLCQEPVWGEHHPQWGVHGECPSSLLQRHQDWQNPGSQVQLTCQKNLSLTINPHGSSSSDLARIAAILDMMHNLISCSAGMVATFMPLQQIEHGCSRQQPLAALQHH